VDLLQDGLNYNMKKTYYYDKKQGKVVEMKEKRDPEPKIHIIPDIEPYLDENMGDKPIVVRSRRHKNQLLRERGLGIK